MLLCYIFKSVCKDFDPHARYAAKLAHQSCTDLSREQRSKLHDVSKGKVAPSVLKKDEFLWPIVKGFWGRAARVIEPQEARRYGRSLHAKCLWEVAVELVTDAARRLGFKWYADTLPLVAEYCQRALSGSTSWEAFADHVDLLDKAGFAEVFLAELWRRCPEEARIRSLPRPLLPLGKPTESPQPLLNPSAPLTLKDTADHIGGQMTPMKLRRLMNTGKVAFRELNRQTFQFSRDYFPQLPEH